MINLHELQAITPAAAKLRLDKFNVVTGYTINNRFRPAVLRIESSCRIAPPAAGP